MPATGIVFDIKRFALHDGPGIRTTVFLKGCPLRCSWCHNPESQGFGVETLNGSDGPIRVGRAMSVNEIVETVVRDVVFFDESGGGVTFSGGEPLSQPDFLLAALDRMVDLDVHRTVDTSGFAPRDVLLSVAERTDLFLFDVKLIDPDAHLAHTGVDVISIHDNLRALCDTGVAIRLRVPVLAGLTDTDRNLDGLRELKASLSRDLPIELLPYYHAAMDKYRRFGMVPPLPDTKATPRDVMQRVAEAVGVETEIGMSHE